MAAPAMKSPNDPPIAVARDDHLPTLDGWRAVAVLAVVFHHFYWSGIHLPYRWLEILEDQGRFGVDIFFAISGFLITSRLLAERARTGTVSIRGFYVRRVFRILPPALLCLAFMVVMPFVRWPPRVEHRPFEPMDWLGTLFFFRNYAPTGFLITGHYWSLSVEEQFYLLWPTLLALPLLRRRLWAVPAITFAVTVWRVLVYADRVPEAFMSAGILTFRTDLRLDALLWGAFAALLVQREGGRAWVVRHLTVVPWLVAIAVFFGSGQLRPEIELPLKAISAPVIIVATVYHPKWLVSRALEVPPLRFIGTISYGIYLFQQTYIPFDLFRLHLVILTAWVSFVVVERPMTDLGRRLLSSTREPMRRWAKLRLVPAFGLLAAALAVYVVTAKEALAQPYYPQGVGVVLYRAPDFRDEEAVLPVGKYPIPGFGAPATDPYNPPISVMSMATGQARVRVCTAVHDGEGAGRCHLFRPNTHVQYVGDGLANRIAFVEVMPD